LVQRNVAIVLHFTIFGNRGNKELQLYINYYSTGKKLVIQPTLLAIAGSDPSGGAGIQADLKTMTSIGVYGAAAITCLTVQNSLGVQEIQPLSADFVRKQIEAVLADHNVTHIKIGMTGTVEIVKSLGQILESFQGTIIYDPVLAATSGKSLLDSGDISCLARDLLCRISFLTPNIPELERLTDRQIHSSNAAIDSALLLLNTYPTMEGIIVKGGHMDESSETVSDFLVLRNDNAHESRKKRINNNNLHGTGCTYASAFASYLCLKNDSVSAFYQASKFMDLIIQFGVDKNLTKRGTNGPLFHTFSKN